MNPSQTFNPRPRTLRQVSAEVVSGAAYPSCMKEFIDALTASAVPPAKRSGVYAIDPSFVSDEPLALLDPTHMAHMGGLAEYVSSLCGRKPPDWSEKPSYFLTHPCHTGGRRNAANMMETTPSAFRRRLLFCGPALQKLHRLKPRPTA